MSDIPVEGTLARPVRLDPFQRIVEVHFGGGIGVIEVVTTSFDQYEVHLLDPVATPAERAARNNSTGFGGGGYYLGRDGDGGPIAKGPRDEFTGEVFTGYQDKFIVRRNSAGLLDRYLVGETPRVIIDYWIIWEYDDGVGISADELARRKALLDEAVASQRAYANTTFYHGPTSVLHNQLYNADPDGVYDYRRPFVAPLEVTFTFPGGRDVHAEYWSRLLSPDQEYSFRHRYSFLVNFAKLKKGQIVTADFYPPSRDDGTPNEYSLKVYSPDSEFYYNSSFDRDLEDQKESSLWGSITITKGRLLKEFRGTASHSLTGVIVEFTSAGFAVPKPPGTL